MRVKPAGEIMVGVRVRVGVAQSHPSKQRTRRKVSIKG